MTLCSDWISGADVAACCDVEVTTAAVFDDAATTASELLFEFSGRRFPGTCEQTVRPCSTWCRCPWQILSRGHIVWNWNIYDPYYGYGWWWNSGSEACGCRPLSRVILSGYAQEVTEVKIDGAVVDPNTYRLDRHRWLSRVKQVPSDDFPHWPGCQNLELPDTEEGTFSVTYTYGVEPPSAGVTAAVELACEIYKQCDGQECKLPAGVVRLARQGVVMDKTPFASWGFEAGKRGRLQKGWQTGMAAVDVFLNGYNPSGLIRQPVIWSPARSAQFGLPT